jgi:hypothetical protein
MIEWLNSAAGSVPAALGEQNVDQAISWRVLETDWRYEPWRIEQRPD